MLMDSVLAALVDRVVHLHDSGLVPTPVAVVGCRENGDDTPIVLPLVAFHDQLMCTSDKVETINVRKLFGNVLSERVTGSPR